MAIARTDDDSWDITESVGATALGVAMARAAESRRQCPLFTDPYAQLFLDAAVERGWRPPTSGPIAERLQKIGDYAATRTKWFDEQFIAAGANGIEQAVILAAGLDARAWRLPWVQGTMIYEIDQPRVLEFKADTLSGHGARPATGYRAVPIDLRQDWPKALRDAGFDMSAPAVWSAEGLLPYLPAVGQDLLFERVASLSAPGSRIAIEAFTPTFFDPENIARHEHHSPKDLWFIEERTDLENWLTRHGWQVTKAAALDLMERYGRRPSDSTDDAVPGSVFIEARLPP